MNYEFATLRTVLNDGTIVLTPAVRKKRTWWNDDWQRIALVEGRYVTLDIPWAPELTEQDCEERKNGYKEVLRAKVAKDVQITEVQGLEELTY